MSEIEFWLRYGLLIFFGSCSAIIILISIVAVEYKLWLKRKNKDTHSI
jgi:hypothetical protein